LVLLSINMVMYSTLLRNPKKAVALLEGLYMSVVKYLHFCFTDFSDNPNLVQM